MQLVMEESKQERQFYTHPLACEDGTECSETSANKTQTPGNYPKETIQHTKHGESLKSRRKGKMKKFRKTELR
jgi:hypothetical protein